MYNKHERKKKNVCYRVSLFLMAISKTGVGEVNDVYTKVYSVHNLLWYVRYFKHYNNHLS